MRRALEVMATVTVVVVVGVGFGVADAIHRADAHTDSECEVVRQQVAAEEAKFSAALEVNGMTDAQRSQISRGRAINAKALEHCTPATTTTTTPTTTTTAPPTTTTTIPPPPSGGVLDLPRVPWEGGPGYWSQFPKAAATGWADPNFFPICVWYGKPDHADELKAVGVNTYCGAEHDGSTIASMTSKGMYVLAQDEWTVSEIGDDPMVVGHNLPDECDMGLGCPGDNQYETIEYMRNVVADLRARNDGRFLYANYGNGVLRTFWASDDAVWREFLAMVDAPSVDKYYYTSSHVCGITDGWHDAPWWPDGTPCERSYAYGWIADSMRRYMDVTASPQWVFVESARPYLGESDAKTITPEQYEGAVWSAIIHEARGIAVFQHNNDYTVCGNYSLVDCDPARLAKIAATHAAVQSLAPAINTQSYAWDFGAGTDTMLKVHDGSAYIFAGVGMGDVPGSQTFTLPAGVTGTTVEVVGEGRTLPVVDGGFVDDFQAEYSHHVYRLAL